MCEGDEENKELCRASLTMNERTAQAEDFTISLSNVMLTPNKVHARHTLASVICRLLTKPFLLILKIEKKTFIKKENWR